MDKHYECEAGVEEQVDQVVSLRIFLGQGEAHPGPGEGEVTLPEARFIHQGRLGVRGSLWVF